MSKVSGMCIVGQLSAYVAIVIIKEICGRMECKLDYLRRYSCDVLLPTHQCPLSVIAESFSTVD